jgi:hypothetical protein
MGGAMLTSTTFRTATYWCRIRVFKVSDFESLLNFVNTNAVISLQTLLCPNSRTWRQGATPNKGQDDAGIFLMHKASGYAWKNKEHTKCYVVVYVWVKKKQV